MERFFVGSLIFITLGFTYLAIDMGEDPPPHPTTPAEVVRVTPTASPSPSPTPTVIPTMDRTKEPGRVMVEVGNFRGTAVVTGNSCDIVLEWRGQTFASHMMNDCDEEEATDIITRAIDDPDNPDVRLGYAVFYQKDGQLVTPVGKVFLKEYPYHGAPTAGCYLIAIHEGGRIVADGVEFVGPSTEEVCFEEGISITGTYHGVME